MGLLRKLSYLQEVAKSKSISKAAENLFVSKSTLSQALSELEDEFSVPLLNRSVNGVTLTKNGERIIEQSSVIFSILDNIRAECDAYNELRRIINFYSEAHIASIFLPEILNELTKSKINSQINTYTVSFEEELEKVKESTNNIGLFLTNNGHDGYPMNSPIYSDLSFHHINTFKHTIVTAKYSKHISYKIDGLSFADIKNIPQIELKLYENDTYSELWKNSRTALNSNYVVSTDNNNVFFTMILNDIGIGTMLDVEIPYGLVERKKMRTIPLNDSEPVDLWLVCNKKSDLTLIEQLCNNIRNTVK